MPKYCPECGSLMDDYSDFCRECGARSSTHHGGYVPWSAKKSIKSHNNSKKVFNQNSDSSSFSRNQRLADNNKSKKGLRGLFRLLPTFIGLLSIILIFCVISGGLLNFDHSNNTNTLANSTNSSSNPLVGDNGSSSDSSLNNSVNNTNNNNKTYLLISYEGPWRGSVGTTDNLRDYNGNHSKKIEFVNMGPDELITANVQKQDSSEGLLIVQLIRNGVVVKESETTTPYGVVTVSE